MTLEPDVYVTWLKEKLVEVKRQADEHQQLAAHHAAEAERLEALTQNIQQTLQGLFGEKSQLFKADSESSTAALNGNSVDDIAIANQEETQNEVVNNLGNQQNNQNNQNEEYFYAIDNSSDFRSPKEMKRQPYIHLGYIEAAISVLSRDKIGMTIDQLVEAIFDIQTEKDFYKAKSSFSVEIRRAVLEGKIGIDPQTEGKKWKRYVLLKNQKQNTLNTPLMGTDTGLDFNSNRNEVQVSYT